MITRLRAFNDYITNKWKSFNSFFDSKIEHFIIALINRLQFLITNAINSSITASQQFAQAVHSMLFTMNLNDNSFLNLIAQWNWMKKFVLTIIIDLQFNVTNLYKFTSLKNIILFNLNFKTIIYEELLIKMNEVISFVTMMSKIEKTFSSFTHWFFIFSIYISIKMTYDQIEMINSALFLFMREINHY